MNPIAFQLGPMDIYWHAILTAGSVLAGALLSTLFARLWGQDPLRIWERLPWVIVLGLVGARLYHALAISPSIGIDRWY